MTKNQQTPRNLGIDLLRAAAMFFVICLHILGQGGVLSGVQPASGTYYFLSLLQIMAYCAVDVYGITTGYLLCTKPFRLSRVVKLWLTTVFWSVAVSCVFFAVVPASRTVEEMVSMFLPILRGRYWFFTAYFVVMLVSPALNLLIRGLSRKQFHLLFVVLFVIFGVVPVGSLGYDVLRISGGQHFSWMVVLYIVGGYLRKYVHQGGTLPGIRSRHWAYGYAAFALMHLLYRVLVALVGLRHYDALLLTNVSPLILGEAVCLFMCFKEAFGGIRSESAAGRLIDWMTPGVYAVYVIHVHPLVFWNKDIIGWFRPWTEWNGLVICGAMLLTAAAVFFACVALDRIRQVLFCRMGIDRTATRCADRLERKIRNAIKE